MSHDLTVEQVDAINAVRTAGAIFIETIKKHAPDTSGTTGALTWALEAAAIATREICGNLDVRNSN